MLKRLLMICLVSFVFAACDRGDDNYDGDGGDGGKNNAFYQVPPKMNLDLQETFSLVVVEEDQGSALALVEEHNRKIEEFGLVGAPLIEFVEEGDRSSFQLAQTGEGFSFPFLSEKANLAAGNEDLSKLKKVTKSGEVKDALTYEQGDELEEGEFGDHVRYPSIKTIAISPKGEIFLHFSDPFIFEKVSNDEDPWDWSSGHQCQIFTSKDSVKDLRDDVDDARDNLRCIDNQHFISSWISERESVFQFDNAGNAFYRAEVPQSSKQLVYKLKKGKTYKDLDKDPTAITEVINANICVENFLVTQSSGIFYTGRTCNNDSGESGFFRYITPTNKMTEIARGWWNFIFDIREATEDSENDGDEAVFFGPNPLSSTTASWDSACVFNFTPGGNTPTERISEVITCGNNIWDWVEVRRQVDVENFGEGYHNWTAPGEAQPTQEWRSEFKRRCEDKSEVFAGGGSQISAIKQDSEGDVYLVGNIRKKREGALTCQAVFRGPHCVVDSLPVVDLPEEIDDVVVTEEEACQDQQGTWVVPGNCNWGNSYSFDSCMGTANTWDFDLQKCTDSVTGQSYSDLNNSADCLQDLEWVDDVCQHSSVENPDVNLPEYNNGSDDEDNNREAMVFADQDECEEQTSRRMWNGETVHYQNVTGDLCTAEETGDIDVMWDWDNAANRFSRMGLNESSTEDNFTTRFLVQNFNCTPVEAAASGDQWTDELKAFGKVNKTSKDLVPYSTANEQAIDIWIVNDNVYYSSYDTTQGKYLLKGIKKVARCINPDVTLEESCTGVGAIAWLNDQCVDRDLETREACLEVEDRAWVSQHSYEILTDFEAYTVSASTDAQKIMVSGLDFTDNSFKTGTLNPLNKNAKIELNKELTGVIRSVLVLD